jgi:hypothetical protein
MGDASFRFATLTQRALDLGGLLEYYPARHWGLSLGLWRYADISRSRPNRHRYYSGKPPAAPITVLPEATVKGFQFSTGVHYRF